MKRLILGMFALFAALLFGSAGASGQVTPEKVVTTHAKGQCTKAKGKCIKPKGKQKKPKVKKKPKPLAPVRPSIERAYHPPIFTTSPRMQLAVSAYKKCMYDGAHPDDDKIDRALRLNLAYRNEKGISGSPDKIGREVCLADALGLTRYETQSEIDRAKGAELLAVSSRFIDFPDDNGNRLPPERRFARLWVKDYIENFAKDLHTYLVSKRSAGSTEQVPLLRVTSLVRSLADQAKQSSPAKCRNEICSTHLTGSTVDIANSGARVDAESRKWIRERLLKDRKDGKIVMIQEFVRPHYHLFVIPPEYVEWYKENRSDDEDKSE